MAYRDPHVWCHTSNKILATVHVQVANNAVEQRITSQVCSVFILLHSRKIELYIFPKNHYIMDPQSIDLHQSTFVQTLRTQNLKEQYPDVDK